MSCISGVTQLPDYCSIERRSERKTIFRQYLKKSDHLYFSSTDDPSQSLAVAKEYYSFTAESLGGNWRRSALCIAIDSAKKPRSTVKARDRILRGLDNECRLPVRHPLVFHGSEIWAIIADGLDGTKNTHAIHKSLQLVGQMSVRTSSLYSNETSVPCHWRVTDEGHWSEISGHHWVSWLIVGVPIAPLRAKTRQITASEVWLEPGEF